MFLWVAVLVSLMAFTHGGRWTGTAIDNSAWFNAINQDIDILNRRSLIFAVKGCKGLDMVFWQYVGSGQYVYIRLGDGDNTYDVLMASPRCTTAGCDVLSYFTGASLDCNAFKLFWVSWDNAGAFAVGQNSVIGSDVLMTTNYNNNGDGYFTLRTLNVASNAANNVIEIYYYTDTPPVMTSPGMGGGLILTVSEDSVVGTVLIATAGTDAEGDTITFGINGNYTDIFGWDGTNYVINGTLDYETQKKYYVNIAAHDGFNVIQNAITVLITDVNDEAPVVTMGSGTVLEELPKGTPVYEVFLVTDPDTDQTFTYALSGTDAALFSVTNGVLTIAQRVDREAKATLSVSVTVTDAANNVGKADLTINVVDINDNGPVCDKSVYFQNVAEGTADENVKLMDALACTDPDTGTNADYTMSIVSGDTGGIFSYTGKQLFGSPKAMDYETTKAYYLTVKLTDQPTTVPKMTTTVLVVVQVTSANEFDPVWSSPSQQGSGDFVDVTIAEDKKHESVITTYVATDSDDGADGDVFYEIVSVTDANGGNGIGKFVLDRENGELRVSDNLDFDTGTGGVASYYIVVKAVDGGGTPRSNQTNQKVILTGVNDNAPVYTSPPVEVSVAEDAAISAVVSSIPVSDADGDAINLSVTGGATAEFSTNALDLVTAATLDFETKKCYSVVMSGTDGTFTTPLSVTVSVTNANDESPVITVHSSPSMLEELPLGTVLYGLYTVTDPDPGDTITVTVAGADVKYFKVAASGDLEIKERVIIASTTLTVEVTATDAAGHSTMATVTISVLDVNDNAPQCNQNVYDVTVQEGSGGNTKLMNAITCADSDASPNSDLKIKIDGGDSGGNFSFNNFELWGTQSSLDYETKKQYILSVSVEDSPTATTPKVDSLVFIVAVTGENEFNPAFSDPVLTAGKFPGVTISEDSPPATLVDTFDATDQDDGQDGLIEYSLVSITTDSGATVIDLFWVDAYSGNLYVGASLDADSSTGGVAYYDLIIKAEDKGTTPRDVQGTMRVTLTGVNDNAPVISVSHDVTVSESSALGDLIVEVTMADADGDTPTLSVGGSMASSFSVSGNKVLLQAALDYDDKTKSCFSLEVSATDGVHTSKDSLTITVSPANDQTPVITVNSNPKLMEELPVGTVVWGIFTVSDLDDGDTFTFTLGGTDSSYFTVTATGGLSVARRVDRETVGDTLTIDVTVQDAASHSDTKTINITVVDINDNAPVCQTAPFFTTVEETNVKTDMKIMDAVTCTDADKGDNAQMDIAIVNGDTKNLFHFKSDWELWGNGSKLNYEDLSATDYTIYLTVAVTDKPTGVAPHTGTITIAVQVTGKNEFAPAFTSPTPTSGAFPNVSMSEDTLPGSIAVTYVAKDDDDGTDGEVFFEIVSITAEGGSSAQEAFTIDQKAGHLRLREALDIDTDTGGVGYYDVVVKVVDKGVTPQSSQHTQRIILTGVNDNAPKITSNELKFTVAEDATVGHNVGTLGVKDYDGDTVTLTVTGTHAAVFKGHASQPDVETLATLDYETNTCYSVEVSVSDGTLETKTTVTILVTDVADVNPSLTPYTFVTMAEELPYGTVVGQLFELTDQDTQDSSTFTIGGTDGANFQINGTSGRVFVTASIDADGGTSSQRVTITATDTGGLTGSTDVDIGVIDINEFAPAFGSSVYTATVAENSASAKIADVVCTDADSGANGDVELVLPSTNNASTIFSVSAMELHADGTKLDYESLAGSGFVYPLILECRDKPTSGTAKTGSVLVTVQVTGVDEFSPAWSSPVPDGSGNFPGVTISENVSPGTVVQTYQASDQDEGADGKLTYTIVSVTSDSGADGSAKFRMHSATGSLETALKLDADASTGGDSYYDIALKASDGNNDISGTIRVTLTDYSDNAPKFTNEFSSTTSVPCTTAVGASLLTLNAADIDTVDQSLFSFKSYSGNVFALGSTSGALTLTADPSSLGTDIYHPLSVIVTDSEDSTLTDEATVYIQLEYCGLVATTAASTPAVTDTTTVAAGGGACSTTADDSAVTPMRVITAVVAVALVLMLGFSLRSLLFCLRPPPPPPIVMPMRGKKVREYERPLEPELVLEDMTMESPDDRMAEESFKERRFRR